MTTHYRKNQQNMLAKPICETALFARNEGFGNGHMEGYRD